MKDEVKVISPESTSLADYMQRVWESRSLITTFAWQELKVQYTQTLLGFSWAVLRPLMVLMLFTFIFDRVIHIPGLKSPYPLFAFSGLMAWNYFSFLVNNGGSVIISNQHLIGKIYFPKIILILSKAIVGCVEFVASVFLLLALMLVLQYPFTINLIWLPFFLVINIITGLMVAIWLNILSVRFRDINHFAPQLIGFVIWLTPVFYPVTLVPSSYTFILLLNPLAGIIQGYRFAILGEPLPSFQYIFIFVGVILLLFVGVMILIRKEDEMSDYL